jgi:hypothetical protein
VTLFLAVLEIVGIEALLRAVRHEVTGLLTVDALDSGLMRLRLEGESESWNWAEVAVPKFAHSRSVGLKRYAENHLENVIGLQNKVSCEYVDTDGLNFDFQACIVVAALDLADNLLAKVALVKRD